MTRLERTSWSKLRTRTTLLGLLVVSILLGSALVVFAVYNYRGALAEAEPATTHEGLHIFEQLAGFHAWTSKTGEASVDWGAKDDVLRDALASELWRSRASYVGLWDSGRLMTSVGVTVFPGMEPTPLRLQCARGHARMSFPGIYMGPRDRPFPPSYTGLRLPAERVVVLEFVPHAADALARRALAGVALASTMAALLTSIAAFLWHLGRRGEQMRAELERKEHLARLGAMSAVLAHEIRNPLASLKGHAQLLAEGRHDAQTTAQIERVLKGATRLEDLTNDLLQFAGSGSVQTSPASPIGVLEAAASAVDSRRVRVSAEGAPERWSLDAGRMEQVLVNLLDNALRVTPPDQQVAAEVARAGADLLYTVRDHGPGVPRAERARVFDAFHTTSVRGTGLGLAVARRIVELHGGRIEIDDGTGGGAVFTVRIPALASQPSP
jgi:signal transduction histidine kinase